MMFVNCEEFFHVGTLKVVVLNYNPCCFKDAKEALGSNILILEDFITSRQESFVSFLKNSVKDNSCLCGFIEENKFEIVSDIVTVEINGERESYASMYDFILPDWDVRVFVSGRYFFVENIKNNKKYFYYAD